MEFDLSESSEELATAGLQVPLGVEFGVIDGLTIKFEVSCRALYSWTRLS